MEEALRVHGLQPLRVQVEPFVHGFFEPVALLDDLAEQGTVLTGDDLSGRRRSRGPAVGHVIGNGVVDFVPDCGDDRAGRPIDGPSHGFLVEGPQIFGGAAAASDDQYIDAWIAVQIGDAAGDLGSRPGSLNTSRPQHDLEPGGAAAEHLDDIADGRTGRRGDHADGLGIGRQGAFALRGEQSFGFQAIFELCKSQGQFADAGGLHLGDVELVTAAALVHRDVPVGHDLHARLGGEGETARLPFEHDRAELAARVLESEITVSGAVVREVGDFAQNPAHGHGFLECSLDPGGYLGDGVRVTRATFRRLETVLICRHGSSSFDPRSVGLYVSIRGRCLHVDLQAFNGQSPAAVRIGLDQGGAELDIGVGRLEADRHLGQKALDGDLGAHADYRVVGPGHARVGQIRRAPGQDAFVGGLHVGVGADHGGGQTVQMPGQGHLLGRGLGVEVDENDRGLTLEAFHLGASCVKRAVDIEQGGAALEIDDPHRNARPRLDDGGALAGRLHRIVDGAQDAFRALQIADEFLAVPDVIAAGDHIDAVVVEFAGDVLGESESAGGVLGIGDDQIDLAVAYQRRHHFGGRLPARSGEDIGDEEYFHGSGRIPGSAS